MSLLTTIRRRQQTITALARKGYRDAYVDQHIKRGIATQIRTMREDRNWTQAELARLTESRQPHIARLENEDYGQYTLQTLKKLASAFDVALVVRFVSFNQFVNYATDISPADLSPASFGCDPDLRAAPIPRSASTATRYVGRSSTGPRLAYFVPRRSSRLNDTNSAVATDARQIRVPTRPTAQTSPGGYR